MHMQMEAGLLIAIIILNTSLSLGLSSSFEKDSTGRDLQELENMLSDEHRGVAYSGLGNIYSVQRPSVEEPQFDIPYRNIFRNDTFFGDFVREFYDPVPEINLTWLETFPNALPISDSNSTLEKSPEKQHLIKPTL